jgi:prepilin-type N-terminal cleavage/methylation domain-containing protein
MERRRVRHVRGRRLRDQAGYTLIEMLVSTAIMVTVAAAIASVMNPSQGVFQAQPEVGDMQQRLRIGSDMLTKDLVMAGAGTYSGTFVGALSNYFAVVLPFRSGAINEDPAGTFKTDTVTIMYVPPTSAQTTITDPMPSTSAEIKVNQQAGCPNNDDLCGFKQGMTVMIFDDTGAYDTFDITEIQAPALHLQHRGQDLSKPYDSNSYIAQIYSKTYYRDPSTDRLILYDGSQTETPLLDNVVGLRFDYFGDPLPPQLKKPVTDPKGPWTTYGPKPPALGVDVANDTWGAGENCTFKIDAGSGLQVPRLPSLGPATGNLVPLGPGTTAALNDGPWCPDAANINRYDADLLRIRKIRVTLRVQTSIAALRGPAGLLFTRGGTSRTAERWVPDMETHFEIAPRNMNLGR